MKKFFKFLILLIIIAFLSIFITYKCKQTQLDDSSLITIKAPSESEKSLSVVFNNNNVKLEENEFGENEYVVISKDNPVTISVTSNTTGIISVVFKAPSKDYNLFYNEILINGKPAITIPQEISFDTPYDYNFIAKKDKEYIIQTDWNKI